jgi:predicted ATP-dependent endonuclease of OLD family
MHLSRLKIESFRIFGSGADALDLKFGLGLTMLVGPNDGGKTAVVDAIRLVVVTTSPDRRLRSGSRANSTSQIRTRPLLSSNTSRLKRQAPRYTSF